MSPLRLRPRLGPRLLLLLLLPLWALLPLPTRAEAPQTAPPARLSPAQMRPVPDPDGGDARRDWRSELRQRLRQPDTAIALLIVGLLLIFLEFNLPGAILPGAAGLLLVLFALYGLSMLPINPVAGVLLLLAFALFPLEAKAGGHGALAATGTALLVFALLHLVRVSSGQSGVHLPVALALGISFGLITAVLAFFAARARRGKRLLGDAALVGSAAIAQTALDPAGTVEVRGELWEARLPAGQSLAAGAAVTVQGRDGLLLLVEAAPPAPASSQVLRVD